MTPLPTLLEHTDPPYCDGEPGECAPPPALSPPSPYYPPASSPGSRGRSTFVTAVVVAGSALVFLALCLSVFLFVRRRKQQRQRRRREALLEAALAPAAPAAFPGGNAGGPGEDVVHHAWNIRTVGLDEAAIESIALARHRAGAGAAADCAVCLGEFSDGELMRLLPKCAHAFHVPCIDTWLRAHVSCPLCRADVLDPAPASTEQLGPPAEAGAGAEQSASSIGAAEPEQPDQQANEQNIQTDQRDQPSSPEHQRHHSGPRGRSFRRVASMDAPSPVAPAEEAPEDEQAGSEKQGSGGAVCCVVSPGTGRLNRPGMKRSLSAGSRWTLVVSRRYRARSSLLPI